MVNIIMKGDSSDWNWATMIKYMNSTAKSSISTICSMASVIISFSPVNTRRHPAGASYPASFSSTAAETRPTLYPSAMAALTATYLV